MRKFWYVIFSFFVLTGLVIYEEILSKNTMKIIAEQTIEIQTFTQDVEHINTSEVLIMVEALENTWQENEEKLCFFVNHKNMESVGVEIARLKATVSTDQLEDFKASLALINFYMDVYDHVMGFSFQNLF